MKELVTIVTSMYNARPLTLEIVDKVFFPGLLNNASTNKQLILIDDCSPKKKETERLIEKYQLELELSFGDVQIIKNETNLEFGSSYNRGIDYAEGDLLFIVNDDIYLTEYSINSMTRTLTEDSDNGIVGAISPYQWSMQNTTLGPRVKEYTEEELEKVEQFADWLRAVINGRVYQLPNSRGMGSCFIMRNNEEAYFDERFKFGLWEDTDLNERILKSGQRSMLDASTYVWHKGSASICYKKTKAAKTLVVNGLKMMHKWKSPIKYPTEFAFACVQGSLDLFTMTSEIKRIAKEKGFWQEYVENFK